MHIVGRVALLVCAMLMAHNREIAQIYTAAVNWWHYDTVRYDPIAWVTVRGRITSSSVDSLRTDLWLRDAFDAGSSNASILVFIDSSGGQAVPMYKFLRQRARQYRGSSSPKMICVARKAMSAAFDLFQLCDERWVTPDAELMTHDASFGAGTKLAEAEQICAVLETVFSDDAWLNKRIAARIGISVKTLAERKDAKWTVRGGAESVRQGLADKVVRLTGVLF
jgi:ATP-dependent protease ClpP protease subunit